MAAIIGPGDHLRPPKMVPDPFFLLLFYYHEWSSPDQLSQGGGPFMAAIIGPGVHLRQPKMVPDHFWLP